MRKQDFGPNDLRHLADLVEKAEEVFFDTKTGEDKTSFLFIPELYLKDEDGDAFWGDDVAVKVHFEDGWIAVELETFEK